MAIVRFPGWYISVGSDTASRLEKQFVEVMKELPMSQAELAPKAGVDQSTVARWAKAKTTPPPATMLKAVGAVRTHLKRLLQQASVTEEALKHAITADEAYVATGLGGAHTKEVAALKKLLEGLEG